MPLVKACLLIALALSNVELISSFSHPRTAPSRISGVRPLSLAAALDDDDDLAALFSSFEDAPVGGTLSYNTKKRRSFFLLKDVHSAILNRDPSAPEKAEAAVRKIQKTYLSKPQTLLCAYNLWIQALAGSRRHNAGQMAESILNQMLSYDRDTIAPPTIITYANVMDAYAKSKLPERAERLLFRLIESDISCTSVPCNIVINAWAQLGTEAGAQRAQDILMRLDLMQVADLKPTKHSYAGVINGWAKLKTEEAAIRANNILQKLLSKAKHSKKKDALFPDTIIFNTVIAAWSASRTPQAGEKAMALLEQTKTLVVKEKWETKPDVVTYNTVLSAWSNCGHSNAALQVERLVKEMHLSNDPDISPNTITYNTVLNAWSKSSLSGAADRAQKVLDYMIRASTKNPNIAPDSISFGCACNAWANSNESDKADRVRRNIDTLSRMYRSSPRAKMRVTNIHYNTLLKACALSDQSKEEALQIAMSTFSELQKNKEQKNKRELLPDMLTYGNMLKCITNLMPPGKSRTDMALRVYSQCRQDGMVGTIVWDQLERAVPKQDLPKDEMNRRQSRQRKPKQTEKKKKEVAAPPAKRTFIVESTYQSGKDRMS